jgi:hypothetical protein
MKYPSLLSLQVLSVVLITIEWLKAANAFSIQRLSHSRGWFSSGNKQRKAFCIICMSSNSASSAARIELDLSQMH